MDGSRVALLGLFGLTACYDPHPPEGAPCTSDDQCIPPQRCVVDRCSTHDAGVLDAPVDVATDAAVDAQPVCDTTGLVCDVPVTLFVCGAQCWARCDTLQTAIDAQAACRDWGAALGEIHSAAEQTCLQPHLIADRTWLGLHQRDNLSAVGAGWTWNPSPGVPLTVTNWATGQPEDGDDGIENNEEQCGDTEATGLWHDAPCDGLRPFLCRQR